MKVLHTRTRTHTLIGFANPNLVCATCGEKVPYWHDPDRCGCQEESFNSPCGHALDTLSKCLTWSPVDGCLCENSEKHAN